MTFSVPAPRLISRPILAAFIAARSALYFVKRVFVCEPLLKAYCTRYGRGLRTGVYIPWVQGSGDLVLGDDVLVDGHVSIGFAARFADRPLLQIGDRTELAHGVSISVGKRVVIGSDCRIARGAWIMDSNGHSVTDAVSRRRGDPPPADEIRPVTIGDNVWVGGNSVIFPGTDIGDGCVISAGSIVRGRIPPYSLVAGNPARVLTALPQPADEPAAGPRG